MKSELIESTSLKKKLKIMVDSEELTSALDKELVKIQKTAHLKGFRKGKAPINHVKAAYSEQASQNILETLVNDNYIKAVKEHNFIPIAMPHVDMDVNPNAEKKLDDGFAFTAEFEIKPDITLKPLSKIKVKAVSYDVKKEDIEKEIEVARDKRTELIPILEDRPTQEKDWVEIDLLGTIKDTGEPLKEGTVEDFLLELGSEDLIPGFEDGLLGMKVGDEKTLDLNLPEDYFQTEIAGKAVEFLVTLNSINKKNFPELNDAFAKEVADVETLKELEDQIKERLETQAKRKADKELNNALLTEFENIHDVDVPETLVKEQVRRFKTYTERIILRDMSEDEVAEYHAKWEGDYRKDAIKDIKTSLLIETLADQENLNPTPEDISNYLADLSDKTDIAIDKTERYYSESEQQDELKFKLMEEKVLQFIKDNATIEGKRKWSITGTLSLYAKKFYKNLFNKVQEK